MNIHDRVGAARVTLLDAVSTLGLKYMAIKVPLIEFEALLVLWGVHHVTVAKYHDDRRFMQMAMQKVGDCTIAVTTDEVPDDIPRDMHAAGVAWGKCPRCGDAMFAYAPTHETASYILAMFGVGPLEIVR